MDIDVLVSRLLASESSWERLYSSKKPVCIYGTGDACERILEQFAARGIKCDGIFASDDFVRDRKVFHGFEVTDIAAQEKQFGDMTVCCAFGSQLDDVMDNIDNIASRYELIFPDLPIAGEEYFSREGLEKHSDKLREVLQMLADDASRKVLLNVLSFKLTGDISLLREVFTEQLSDIAEIISPQKNDSYADLGAYNGDTAESFISLCPEYGNIYAFEPDVRSFRKCVERHLHRDNITFINACAWERDEMLRFSQSAGRQSKITDSGKLTAARSLDSVLCGKRCDIIKLDVEGAEREALIGSAETIKNFRPKLIVSAYHRPYDLITLPLMICEMGSYDIYMRQPPYYPAWDTCIYAVPK